jgi:hypothetical protein
MSCIYDPEAIAYLINAATSAKIHRQGRPQSFRWFYDDTWQELPPKNDAEALRVASILNAAMLGSVCQRYNEEPGENDIVTLADIRRRWSDFDPVQVIKTCDYFEYQSSDADTWEGSEAAQFINALRSTAARALPGYDAATWGSPEPVAA